VPAAFAGAEARVSVGGDTAEELDYHETVDFWLPLVLLLVFRSIVVAAKAIVMNLLSVGAAYGLLVLVFQEGIGNELLGLRGAETIDAWVPLFLFAVLFGSRWTTTSSCSAASASATPRRATTDAAGVFGVADGLRRGRRPPHRRDDRARRPRTRHHDAPGPAQLVPSLGARMAPRRGHRGGRASGACRASARARPVSRPARRRRARLREGLHRRER
jgi:hypothetical protein